MILRKNILPRTIIDALCFAFVLLIIPTIYWFEYYIVLSTYYTPWTFWYNVHFVCGNFITFNLIGNLLALVLTDTSVRGTIMPTELRPGWHLCPVCECIVPPRSWHCDTCRTCILKRDHHCVFSACCVGHRNHRYFMVFVLYVIVATAYSTYFNIFFIIDNVDLQGGMKFFNFMFPLAMLMLENTLSQVYLLTFLVLVVSMVFTLVIFGFHVNLILHGQVTHERNFNIAGYYFGTVGNIVMVFGKKWKWAWISPMIHSELPHDGVHWEPRETVKDK